MRTEDCYRLFDPPPKAGEACGCGWREQLVSLAISLLASIAVTLWLVGSMSWVAMGVVFLPTFLLTLGLSGCMLGVGTRGGSERIGVQARQ